MKSTVFTDNGTQAVPLPAEARFPESVKQVVVRVVEHERIITPVGSVWTSFFAGGKEATGDFMEGRVS